MTEPYFDLTEMEDPDDLGDVATMATADESEGYRARAYVLLSDGPDRRDFVRVLDALSELLVEREEIGAGEAAADLASVLKGE